MRGVTMPAGRYYVGDLCYVMHPEWDEVCSLTIDGSNVLSGQFNLKDGRRFALYTTAHGDGLYEDQNGYSYGVDAGLIGCIKIDDIREDLDEAHILELGNIVEFPYGFDTSYDDGKICIGHLVIDTDPPYSEDEYDDEGEYDYEDEEY